MKIIKKFYFLLKEGIYSSMPKVITAVNCLSSRTVFSANCPQIVWTKVRTFTDGSSETGVIYPASSMVREFCIVIKKGKSIYNDDRLKF